MTIKLQNLAANSNHDLHIAGVFLVQNASPLHLKTRSLWVDGAHQLCKVIYLGDGNL
jgi:hypothetical protein